MRKLLSCLLNVNMKLFYSTLIITFTLFSFTSLLYAQTPPPLTPPAGPLPITTVPGKRLPVEEHACNFVYLFVKDAKYLAVIGLFIAGATLIFGDPNGSEFVRRITWLVFCISLAMCSLTAASYLIPAAKNICP